MKTGYLELNLLLLCVHIGRQLAMAKHPHHHRDMNRDCYRCPQGFGVERPCSHFHDTECGACAPDHYSSHRSSWRPCYPCSRCGAGLYVAHRCTAERDTVCDSCHTYRGPHNEDFYERCVRPLLDASRSLPDQSSRATENHPVLPRVPTSAIVASGVVVGASAVVLVAACFVAARNRLRRRGDESYPYTAVSTKEAVML